MERYIQKLSVWQNSEIFEFDFSSHKIDSLSGVRVHDILQLDFGREKNIEKRTRRKKVIKLQQIIFIYI